jgi:radical SAM family protein
MLQKLRKLWRNVRHPVYPELRNRLREIWEEIPEKFRTPQQMYGRYSAGCTATLGVMPRCDFACTGCYLGEEANTIPRLPLEAVKEQMRVIRKRLGPWGNLQITDGEVTLLPPEELVELIRFALSLDLIPMVMSHGDTFLRQPGLLERLMAEADLEEISIHVDITQRGRIDREFRYATSELELMPLRDRFADLIRDARKKTGKRLRAATTITVVPENVKEVGAVAAWVMRNADAFSIFSLQPIAQVGRTEDGLGDSTDVEVIWDRIAEGVHGAASAKEKLLKGWVWIGHPDCNRYTPGTVASEQGKDPRYVTLHDKDDPRNDGSLLKFMEHWGGLQLRSGETGLEIAARLLGMMLHKPWLWLTGFPPYLYNLMRRFDPEHPMRFAWRLLRGRVRMNHLSIISHHFMSRKTIETPVGQERLALCIFKLPVHGKMISMCETNALGAREAFYEEMREQARPEKKAEPVGV